VAFDQNITYKVNVDDSNFQSKLTQMRASMDSSMGGLSGAGFSSNMMYGAMGVMSGGGGYGGGGGGGVADFGTQIRPVSYTPPAIAMQPHFGMFQISQTLGQAGLGAMGPLGAGASGMMTNFSRGGFSGVINGPGAIPGNVSGAEYMAMSARGFGDRLGDAAAITGLTGVSTGMQLAAGGAGYAAGASLFAGGVGQFFGGMAGASLATLPITMAVGKTTDMMADNRQLQTALGAGSFRFMTGGGSEIDQNTGRGMSRKSRFDVASSIQGMEMNDQRFGMDDYKQILEGGMQFDMFSGTRDVEDFKGKFKGLVDNLKTVTATLHTSLKDGIEVIRGMRDMGVTDPGEVTRLTMGSEMRGRMSGRTGMEMMAVGQAGAEIFRGTGVNMERGFELNQMNVQSVRGMLNNGTISRDTVAQAGGENSLAQQMTAGALASFQTAHGRAAMMANYNPATNSMNPNMMGNLASGNAMSQIANAAGMGPAALMKFQAHQEEMISSMSPQSMQIFGLSTAMGTARMLSAGTGADMETSMRVSMQNMGMSRPVIDANLGLLKQDPTKMREDMEASVAGMRTQAGMEDLRNRFNIGKRISNAWSRTISPIANALGSFSEGIGEDVDSASLMLAGGATRTPGMLDKDLIARGAALAAGGAGGGATDASSSLYGRLIGGQNGDALANSVVGGGTFDATSQTYSYKGATFRQFDSVEAAQSAGAASGLNYTVAKASNGKYIGTTNSEMTKVQEHSRGWQSTSAEQEAANKETANSLGTGKSLASLGEGASLGTVLSTMIGAGVADDLQNDKISNAEFEKKYGKSRGAYTAVADNYFKKYGGFTPSAAKSFKEHRNSMEGTDSAARTSSNYAGSAASAYMELSNDLHDRAVSGGGYLTNAEGKSANIQDLLSGNQKGLAELYGDDDDVTKKAKLADMLGGYSGGLDKVISSINKDSGRKAKLLGASNKIASAAFNSSEAANAAGGGASGASIGVGDVSGETVKVLEAQSAQLLANYKQLIALSEQLNKSMKGR
jgi:hypothetical protein